MSLFLSFCIVLTPLINCFEKTVATIFSAQMSPKQVQKFVGSEPVQRFWPENRFSGEPHKNRCAVPPEPVLVGHWKCLIVIEHCLKNCSIMHETCMQAEKSKFLLSLLRSLPLPYLLLSFLIFFEIFSLPRSLRIIFQLLTTNASDTHTKWKRLSVLVNYLLCSLICVC